MAKKQAAAGQRTGKIQNRRARYDYELGDEIIAGIVLNGRETKALRLSHGSLQGAFVTLKNGEVWLMNATITSTKNFEIKPEEQTQARKLLVTKREIETLKKAKDEGKTIVPIEILTKSRYIKLKIAPGRGKKKYDKRQTLKKRDETRQMNRAKK